MQPDHEILYNTMCSILEKLSAIEVAMKDNTVLADSEGMTLKEIAKLKKVSVSHLRIQSWLLPLEEPEYGKNPVVYSRRQIIEHERLIEEKGIKEVRRIWSSRVMAERRGGGPAYRKRKGV